MEINFQLSAGFWWIPIIVSIAILYSYFLYFYKKNFSDLSKLQLFTLAGLRVITLTAIGFLLLIPIIKTVQTNKLKPTVFFAIDQSQSVVLNKDSIFYKNDFPVMVNQMVQHLTPKFDVELFGFGEKADSLNWLYQQTETNFEALFNELDTYNEIKRIDALVLASDGIVNRGLSPVYAASAFSFPIYTIALGDTQMYADLEIKQLEFNKVVFKGNKFPLVASVSAHNFEGALVEIAVFQNDIQLATQPLIIDTKNFFKKVSFMIPADSSGINEYIVKIKSPSSESNLSNNNKPFYIEVNEERKNILLLFQGYHPDIAVFQKHIESNQAFKLTKKQGMQIPDSIDTYDVIILHQLPSTTENSFSKYDQLISTGKPILFMIGQQTSIVALNQIKTVFQSVTQQNLFNEVLPVLNENFNLFTVTFDNNQLNTFPPLVVPFGDILKPMNGFCLFNQKIEKITTTKPLWFFSEQNQSKYGFVVGEGIWKWYLEEYRQNSDHAITNELITKSIQYLLTNKKQESLVVEIPQTVDIQKNVEVTAKLYNASDEQINDPEVNFDLFDAKGNVYPYVFQRVNNNYYLDLGTLAQGEYQYTARLLFGEKPIIKSGKFFVQESTIEKADVIADHLLLARISSDHEGKLYYTNQLDTLSQVLLNSERFKPRIISEKGYIEFIHFKWILFVLLMALTLEWFLRKYWGII